MKLIRHLIIFAATLFVVGTTTAQDIHFSQFYLSPLNLNPAMTGLMECNHRLTANYRNQWQSVLKSNAFNTYSVSYDMRVPVGRYDNFGWGLSLWGDRAGELNFSTMEARTHFAYSKRIAGSRKSATHISVGAEAGVAQRSIDFLNARWGTQNDGGVFNPNLPTQEEYDYNNFLFADVSGGVLLYGVLNETSNYYVGGTFSHLNRANQSFNDGDGEGEEFEAYYSKLTIHAGGEFMLTDRIGLVPGIVIFDQGPSFQLNTGTSLKFNLGSGRRNALRQAFHLGLWGRLSNRLDRGVWMDAIILSTRFDFEEFTLGFSYDVNISSLQAASNSNGAYELSISYKICNGDRRGVMCPTF